MFKVKHPDFPEYFVRDDGFVERAVDSQKHPKAGDMLKGRVLVSGYRQFKLVHRDGTQRLVRANRLVTEAFHGPAPSIGHHSAHRDGDRLNNTPGNLYWATPSQNKQDSIRHGTAARGEKIGIAKLTFEQVAAIRNRFDGKRGSLTKICKEFGLSRANARRVLDAQTWAHVPIRVGAPKCPWDALTKEGKREEVARLASLGKTAKQTADQLGAGRDAVMHFASKNGISFMRRWGALSALSENGLRRVR